MRIAHDHGERGGGPAGRATHSFGIVFFSYSGFSAKSRGEICEPSLRNDNEPLEPLDADEVYPRTCCQSD